MKSRCRRLVCCVQTPSSALNQYNSIGPWDDPCPGGDHLSRCHVRDVVVNDRRNLIVCARDRRVDPGLATCAPCSGFENRAGAILVALKTGIESTVFSRRRLALEPAPQADAEALAAGILGVVQPGLCASSAEAEILQACQAVGGAQLDAHSRTGAVRSGFSRYTARSCSVEQVPQAPKCVTANPAARATAVSANVRRR